MKNPFKSATPPEPDQFAEQEAEQARETSAITVIDDETRRLDAAAQAATAAQQRAHAALAGIIGDAMSYAIASDEELTVAKRGLVSAAKGATQAAEALAAHNAKHQDLPGRRQKLHDAKQALDVEKAQAGYLVDVAEWVQALFEAAQCEWKVFQRLQNAPPNAKLIPVTAPAGTFRPMAAADGRQLSIYRDDVLKAVALAYPEVLLKALPDENLAAQLLAEVEAWRGRGSKVLSFGGQPKWHQAGGFSTAGIDELDLLCGRTRRELHGLV